MFYALSDATRRAMLERLVRGPASVTELARPFDMALPSLVQHLGVLEDAGIVTSTKVGRVRTYQLAPEALTPAAEWIGRQRLHIVYAVWIEVDHSARCRASAYRPKVLR